MTPLKPCPVHGRKPLPTGKTPAKSPFANRKQLLSRIGELESELASAKASTAPPAAVARTVEQAAKRTAATLGASRRASTAPKATAPATVTAAQFAPPLQMTREEFAKLTPSAKSNFCKSNGKII